LVGNPYLGITSRLPVIRPGAWITVYAERGGVTPDQVAMDDWLCSALRVPVRGYCPVRTNRGELPALRFGRSNKG